MKEYPLRIDIGDELQNICECGHADYYHDDECEECVCPEYIFEQTLTRRNARKLHHAIRIKHRESGYTV